MSFHRAIAPIALASLLAVCQSVPAAGQEAPALPDVERLVADRMATVERGFDVQLRQLDHDRGGAFRRLFVDRVELSGAYGSGLTLTDKDDGDLIVTSSQLQTNAKWAITYKVPLNAFFSRGGFALEREIKEAEYREKLLAEEIEIRKLHNGYLEARAEYERPRSGSATASAAAPAALEAAFEMRALALELLVLTRRQGSEDFARWNRFPGDAGAAGTRIASH